ncbi:MAG TPA: alpha/beta hydrolase [Thermoanaerobaculia bacterium]|nr:alpha/beta hydrolase [Thermoanaerobaculia bacterium]
MLLYLFSLLTRYWLSLTGARRKRLRVGSVRLVYYVLGPEDGEPWVVLHGLGSVAATWGKTLFRLRRDCRLIVPELSSFGGSEIPGHALDIKDGAKVVARLIEKELGRRPVTLAGLSLGGWLAVRLALARPELVARLVLVNTGGYRQQDWDAIEQLVRVNDMAGVERLYGAMFVRIPWIMEHSRGGFLQAYTSPVVQGVLDRLTPEDTFDDEDLRQLRMPTDLIWGDRDGLFRIEGARAMAEAIPDATLEVLEGCGHAIHLECPDRLADAMQQARRRVAPRTARTSRTPRTV